MNAEEIIHKAKKEEYIEFTEFVKLAILQEREACAGLRKEIELQGKLSSDYEDGFWDGLQKYEDLIRARSSK